MISPCAVIFPPTCKLLPIPTPPTTVNAPLLVEVDDVVFNIETAIVVNDPLLVTLCNVLVFQIVTTPVEVLTAVSVPAIIAPTPKKPIVAVVKISALFI